MGKLLTFFDSTAHRVVGGLPPPVPSTSQGSAQQHAHQPGGPKVTTSQSTMAMSMLVPSASVEPVNEWTGESSRLAVPNRSISEPDFGRSPKKVDFKFLASLDFLLFILYVTEMRESERETKGNNKKRYDFLYCQVDSSQEAISSNTHGKSSASSGSSRFGRFGSQLFQKTVGLIIRSRPDRQVSYKFSFSIFSLLTFVKEYPVLECSEFRMAIYSMQCSFEG